MNRRAAWLLAARVTSAATTVAVLALLARLRGPDELGLVAIGFAAGAILAVLTDVGMGSLIVREGARRPTELGRLVATVLGLRVVLLPVVLGAAWLVIGAVFGEDGPIVWLAAAGLAVQQTADLTRSVALARDRAVVLAVHSIAENIIWLAAIAAPLAAGAELSAALLAGFVAFGGSVAVGLAIVWFVLGVRLERPSLDWVFDLGRAGMPFALFALIGTTYSRLDTILVGLLAPGAAIVAAGAYFSSARLVAAFEYLPDALGRSLLPELSREYVANRSGVRGVLSRPVRFLLYVGVPIPFGTLIVGAWVMALLFGPEIATYSWVFVVLAALVPLRFLGLLFGFTLTSADGQWRRVAAASSALVAVTAIDILLLPSIGIAGALVGATAAVLLVAVIYAIGVRELIGPLSFLADGSRALVAAAIAFAIGSLALGVVPPPVAAGVFGAAYLAGIVLLDRATGTLAFGSRVAGP